MNNATGGSAFPQPSYVHDDGTTEWDKGNLTLRDYFAAKALNVAAMAFGPEKAAVEAYRYADAMLKAREVSR